MIVENLMVGDCIVLNGRNTKIENFELLEQLARIEYDLNYNQEKINEVFQPMPISSEALKRSGFEVDDSTRWPDNGENEILWYYGRGIADIYVTKIYGVWTARCKNLMKGQAIVSVHSMVELQRIIDVFCIGLGLHV